MYSAGDDGDAAAAAAADNDGDVLLSNDGAGRGPLLLGLVS